MLFADDVVLVDESRTWVNRKLELWRRTSVGLEKKLAARSSARARCGSARLGAARELGTSRAEPLFSAR